MLNHILCDNKSMNIGGWKSLFKFYENFFHGADQSPCSGLFLIGPHRQLIKRSVFKLDVNPIGFEILFLSEDNRVVWILQDRIKVVDFKFLKNSDHRKPSDKLRLKSIGHEVLGLHLSKIFGLFISRTDISPKAHSFLVQTLFDDILQTSESTAHDKKDVLGIDYTFFPLPCLPVLFDRFELRDWVMGNFKVHFGLFHRFE